MIWQGAWPAVIDADGLARKAFYDALVARYVERDVRPLVNLAKPDKFRVFLRALAMVSGEELRFNVISRFAGVHTITVKRWLTVAERTGLIYLLPPFDGRIGRQLVKSPKIYLIDTGLLAHLLRIDSPQTMAEHPLAEKFFETFVVTEILKSWVHNGRTPDFCFFKESRGMEIALLIRSGGKYFPVAVTTKQHPLPADSKWSLKLARLGVKTGPAAVISTAPGAYAVAPDVVVQNVWSI